MAQTKFKAQPLRDVGLRLVWRSFPSLSLDQMNRLYTAVQPRLPILTHFAVAPVSLPGLEGTGMPPALIATSGNYVLQYDAVGLSVTWRYGIEGAYYDGFDTLFSLLKTAVHALQENEVKIASLAYHTVLQNANWADYLSIPGLTKDLIDSTVEINWSRRLESGIEYRIQVWSTNEELQDGSTQLNSSVATSGGMLVEGLDLMKCVERDIHDEMQIEFRKLITQKAAEEWSNGDNS